MKTDTGKNEPKIYFGSTISVQAKNEKGAGNQHNRRNKPENRHCLRGLDGKYGRWDEVLRVISNGNLKIVQNWTATDTDTEKDEDDENDEEDLHEENGTPKVYDASERDGRYGPTRTNLKEDAL